MNTIGDRIRIIRKEHGLTQKEFGEKLSISTGMVCMYEHDQPRRTERTLNAICKEFGINKEWLTLGIGEMKNKDEQLSPKLKKEVENIYSLEKKLEMTSKHMSHEDWERLNRFMDEIGG